MMTGGGTLTTPGGPTPSGPPGVGYQIQGGRDYLSTLNDLLDQQSHNQGYIEVFITGGAYNF
jgi:hypothetical protein